MKCPVCATPDLLMTERQGIEIDYCPQCRGVWLDRGELDKIIERSTRDVAPAVNTATPQVAQPVPPMQPSQMPQPYPQAPQPYYDQRHGHGDKHGHDSKHGYDSHGYPRKKSVWQELFD
jgi:Zn-finger nucleic acid-binding protein